MSEFGDIIDGMSDDQVRDMSMSQLNQLMKKHKLFRVKDAIAWLQKQDPDAGLFYFEPNSNAWCDMPSSFFTTVAVEKPRQEESLRRWYRGTANIDNQVSAEMKEIFRYVDDNDVLMVY